jgi:hypothetical protein
VHTIITLQQILAGINEGINKAVAKKEIIKNKGNEYNVII